MPPVAPLTSQLASLSHPKNERIASPCSFPSSLRRSNRDPANAWSKPLVIRVPDSAIGESSRAAVSRRSLNMGGASSSSSPARPMVSEGGAASGDSSSVATKSSPSGDGPSSILSISSKRSGSTDSGLNSSPAPSCSARSSEERHASSSRSRTHSGKGIMDKVSSPWQLFIFLANEDSIQTSL